MTIMAFNPQGDTKTFTGAVTPPAAVQVTENCFVRFCITYLKTPECYRAQPTHCDVIERSLRF